MSISISDYDVATKILLVLFITWASLEFMFYIYIRFHVAPRLNKQSGYVEPWFKHPKDIFQDMYAMFELLGNSYTFQRFASGFCLQAKFEDIHSQNFDQFLSWALFCKKHQSLDQEQMKAVELTRNSAAERFKFTWNEGLNSSVRHCNFNLEPVCYIHRPLALYWLLQSLELYTSTKDLWLQGFRKYHLTKGCYYWIRVNKASKKLPSVIIHGICTGINYYVKLIRALSEDRTVIIYNYDAVKMNSMVFQVPTAYDVNKHMNDILLKYKFTKAAFVCHSWGTFVFNWILKLSPNIVEHVSFIDPMSLIIVLPESTYTLVYKPSVSFADKLLYYFVRNDLTISYTLRRHFAWYNMYLDFAEIPVDVGVTIGIAGKDELLSLDAINKLSDYYINKRNTLRRSNSNIYVAPMKKLIWDDLGHSEAVTDDDCIKSIVALIGDNEYAIDQRNIKMLA